MKINLKKMIHPKLFAILKRFLFVVIIIFSATFLQIYWAMGSLSERMSSSCLDCWFVEDVFMMSVITSIFLGILFSVLFSIRNKYLQIVIQFLLLASIWFFWDYTVFVERESSWSTYLFNEELYYTFSLSFLPILILSLVSLFLVNYVISFRK